MGLQIFETSGTFNPASRGLKAGDTLDVICVGGGSSGVFYKVITGQSQQLWPSVSGGDSSFGAYVSSANGITMGRGGPANNGSVSGCGAGGYLPGVPIYGGNGGNGSVKGTGLAGSALDTPSIWCNYNGSGNKGAGAYEADIPAGNGYGAGGSGHGFGASALKYPAPGGDAGKIAFGSVTLQNTNAINVTVGAGGVNEQSDQVSGAQGVVLVFW